RQRGPLQAGLRVLRGDLDARNGSAAGVYHLALDSGGVGRLRRQAKRQTQNGQDSGKSRHNHLGYIMKIRPVLAPEFGPASLWNRAYRAAVKASGAGRPFAI